MMLPIWHEEAIGKHHNRHAFDCGDAALNDFLRHHARQNHDKGGAKTFVAVERETGSTVLGFYSLSAAQVRYDLTLEILRRGLPRHDVPGFRLGRLAVAQAYQGHGLGCHLLLLAGRRCLRAAAEVGGVALIIDAKNQRVAEWYQEFGALAMLDDPLTLMLPLMTVREALVKAGKM